MAGTVETGIRALDEAYGGLPEGTLVQVYGPPASGKTSLALALARRQSPSALVLPERPHARRIRDVLGSVAERTLIARPGGFQAQARAVDRAAKLLGGGQVGYAALDSLTFLYRFERLSAKQALQGCFEQLYTLRAAARDGGGVAVFTNQVRGGPDGFQALGGPGIAHASDVIVSLEVLSADRRRLRVEKHPYEATGRAFDVNVTGDGVA